MKEEDEILKKIGKESSFKVPDNYFENLTSEVMSKLPEKETIVAHREVGRWSKLKPLFYMAAMFVGAALIIKVASVELGSNVSSTLNITENMDGDMITDQYISEAVNGSMMDDYSLYVYLTDASAE